MARQRVLGLPIGHKKQPRHQLAKTAGAAAAIIAPAIAVPVARKVAPTARKVAPAARKVGKATQGASDLVGKGEELASKASDAVEKASTIKEAVSSHSSTIGKVGGLISAVAKGGKSGSKPKLSHLIEQHTDIAAPRSVVYNQWTQLEMFPTLTKGIESVEQEEDDKTKWTAKIGPSRRTWTGKIVEQIPDERIAWKSEGGASLQGVVTFHSLDVDLTRVLLQMEYKPTGPVEWVGNTLRIQRRRAKRDLRLFKHFVELRGEETGAWRGRIDDKEKLEPQFSGQGKVEGAKKSQGRNRGSGGSAGASSRSSSSGDGDQRSSGRSRRTSSPANAGGRPSSGSSRSASSSNGRGADHSSGNGRGSNGRSSSGRSSTGQNNRRGSGRAGSAGQSARRPTRSNA